MTTLKEAIESLRSLRILSRPKRRVTEELLGQYKGIIPEGKASTDWIKQARTKLYGKVK